MGRGQISGLCKGTRRRRPRPRRARAGCAVLAVFAVLILAIFAYAFLAAGVGFVGGGAVAVPRFAAYVGVPLSVLAFLAVLATGYHAEAATPFWSALSTDATRVEEGATASVIARSPLWPNGQLDGLRSSWQELEAGLLAAKQDWQVWTLWYGDRLDGRVREEELELAYVRIGNGLWKQGPAAVNAEIKRRIEECAPPLEGPRLPNPFTLKPAARGAGLSFTPLKSALAAARPFAI